MIKNPIELKKLQKEWDSVSNLRNFSTRVFGATHGAFPTNFIDIYQSTVLIIAYGVLQKVLIQFVKEGVFLIPEKKKSKKGKSPLLGTLMNASKSSIAWADFNLIWEGKEKRDEIAHEGACLPRKECWKYIDAIGREFKSWGIIQ